MTGLPWFARRADSLDEILALTRSYRIDSLVVAIEQALDAKSSQLSDAERAVLAVEALER